jgi:hypothetical protein
MCDRHGNLGLPSPTLTAVNRRSFLKATAAGTHRDGCVGRHDGLARFGPRRVDRQRNPRQRFL